VVSAPLVSATQADANPQAAADAAVMLSTREAAGDFEELYALMHPDAQAIIPATAVVGWYQDEFAPLGPGVSTVTGVQFVTWTWPVTGKTYLNVAEVSYEQPFANGSVAQDVVRLVESDGMWRWFFGRSRAFVDQQIQKYAGGQEAAVPDREEAAAAAVELSRFEAASDFNALYDRIHPDAHAVIPRAAVIGWFQDNWAPLQPGISTVTGVQFVEWTWAVTGVTYPYTAEVSFAQPMGDGSVLHDVVRLVEFNGEWRWFFGRSRDFVDEQIAKYVQVTPDRGAGTFLGPVAEDLDIFWRETLSVGSRPYDSPLLTTYDRPVNTQCGAVDPVVGPFYCPADETIYLEDGFMLIVETSIGDFAAAFVVAHEWAHHVQMQGGISKTQAPDEFGEVYSIQIELMADCYAGVWAQDADTRGLLDVGDVDEAVLLALQIGDAPGTSQYDPSAHGSNAQRVKAFLDGYFGLMGCDRYL
ncbi:MAG TPA: neutral zinc metallopeptidase, partial [Thermomicrobiales bacterium]|nr:neutral zinc metallopeptidase [Thermomicrobiales bacterium]